MKLQFFIIVIATVVAPMTIIVQFEEEISLLYGIVV